MSSVFERAVAAVLKREGGYSNDPRDNGGETKYGISKRAYPQLNIASLTIDQAIEIYRRDYWLKIRGDDLPRSVAWCVFDQAVNRGVGAASMTLQRALGVMVDGSIGPETIAAARRADWFNLVANIQAEAVVAYADLDDWRHFGRGWTRRAITTAMEAQLA